MRFDVNNLLLCVDAGNTQTVLGVFKGKKLTARWRIRTNRERTADEYGHLIGDLLRSGGIEVSSIRGIAISCVVPSAMQPLIDMSRGAFDVDPLVIGPGIKTGLPILYDNPREVGADRIANSVAAFELYRRAVVVIDFGTAITFDVISESGEYLGGVIFPGIQISLDALFMHASKLPRVELEKPARVVGRDTVSSIQSGIVYGYSGLVDSIVCRIAKDLVKEQYVVATGGLAPIVVDESKTIREVVPDLTLVGLRILFERNR